MLSKPSKERDLSGLNSIELQTGHLCRIQSRCGNQLGQVWLAVFISSPPSPFQWVHYGGAHYGRPMLSESECRSSHASRARMLPVAIAMQESAAP